MNLSCYLKINVCLDIYFIIDYSEITERNRSGSGPDFSDSPGIFMACAVMDDDRVLTARPGGHRLCF